MKPLSDRVVIKRTPPEEKTKGGIILAHEEKQDRGTVISTGPGLYYNGELIPLEVKLGDVVLFGKYAGAEFTLDGEEFLLMREQDIIGVDHG